MIFSDKKNTVHYALFLVMVGYLVPLRMNVGVLHINAFRIIAFLFLLIIFLEITTYRFSLIKNTNKADMLFIVFVLSVSISVFWSLYKYDTIRSAYDLFFVLFFYLIVSNYRINENHKIFVKYLVVSAYAMGLLIIGLVILNLLIYGSVRFTPRDISSPNQLARFSLFVIALIYVGLLKNKNIAARSFCFVLILLLFLTVLISASRGGALGLVLLCFLILLDLMKEKFINTKRMVQIFVLSVLVVSSGYYATRHFEIFSMAVKRLEATIELQRDEDILGKSRYHMYKESFEIAKKHWLCGIGYGSFKSLMFDSYRQAYYHLVIHNWTLDIVVGCGFFVLALFCYWLFVVFKTYKRVLCKIRLLEDRFLLLEVKGLFNGCLLLLLIGLTQPMLNEIYFFLGAAGIIRLNKILTMRNGHVNQPR